MLLPIVHFHTTGPDKITKVLHSRPMQQSCHLEFHKDKFYNATIQSNIYLY